MHACFAGQGWGRDGAEGQGRGGRGRAGRWCMGRLVAAAPAPATPSPRVLAHPAQRRRRADAMQQGTCQGAPAARGPATCWSSTACIHVVHHRRRPACETARFAVLSSWDSKRRECTAHVTRAHRDARTHTQTRTHARTHACTQTRPPAHARTHACAHERTQALTHTHTRTHATARSQLHPHCNDASCCPVSPTVQLSN